MTTKYSAHIEDNDVASVFRVTTTHYINSIPGSGKTTAALRIAKQTLHNGEIANHVLVYAAPTHALIEQFHTNLKKMVTPAQAKNIRIVDSRQTNGVAVAKRFHDLLNGSTDSTISIKKVPNGTILLVTHDCLRLTALNMPGKERISLIFDEARQCMQETLNMQLPVQVLEQIRSNVEIHESLQDTTVTRWSWLPGKRLDENTVRTLWRQTHPRPAKNSITKCMKFIINLRNAAQHIWVHTDSDALKVQDFKVNVTLSPSRMFANYGKVLIMSAFFEHSQMYHMLKRQEVDLSTRRGREKALAFQQDAVVLVNVTDKLIDSERIKNINKKRMTRATMTYLLEDESLSKNHLQRGVVIPYKTRDDLKQLSIDYLNAFESEGKPMEFKRFIAAIRTEGDNTHSITSEAYERRDVLLAAKPSKYSVVQYMTKASMQLQRAWLKRNKLSAEPLLVCVNAKEATNQHSRVWFNEELDAYNEGCGSENEDKRILEVPVVCQGRNDWQNFNTAAFIATTKMPPDQARFLKKLLPNYDSDLDRTVDQCIQMIFRSSLRDAKSNTDCFLIVSDKKLAKQVNACLGNHMLIVDPESLIAKWHRKSIALLINQEDPEVVRERNKIHQSTPEYKERRVVYNREYSAIRTSTTYGKEYRRISSVIKRREDRLSNDPKNKSLIKEIAALREQRSNLEK